MIAPYLKKCDIYIVVFALDSNVSLENALKVWLPECQKHATPEATVMMVGSKSDMNR